MSKMKNKFVVYTALFGDYDDLIDPKENYEGCDFICFTDQKHLKSNIWDIRIVEDIDLPLNMMNRKYKILPHLFLSEYKWSLYVDSNIAILKNPLELAEKYLRDYNLAIPKHPLRSCLYEEAEAIIERNKAKVIEVYKQVKVYQKASFPKNYGLSENNLILRNHSNNEVINIMESVWRYFMQISLKRDQLVLMYIFWIENYKNYLLINENSRNSLYFKVLVHRQFKNRNFIQKVFSKLFYIRKRIIDKYILKILVKAM